MKYEIKCEPFPVVICQLENGEQMETEKGAMIWMSPNIEMSTSGGGGLKKMFTRAISGESMFQNIYTANGSGTIAFASSYPGRILPLTITPGRSIILQKGSFLASERAVDLSMYINQKATSGLFAGEGFVMQKLSGNGVAFAEVYGELIEYDLAPGQQIVVSSGNVMAFEETVTMTIRQVKGAKNVFLGGEGLFHTILTGPGKIWLQTMSLTNLAQELIPYLPTPRND